jgi:hypothetical protein
VTDYAVHPDGTVEPPTHEPHVHIAPEFLERAVAADLGLAPRHHSWAKPIGITLAIGAATGGIITALYDSTALVHPPRPRHIPHAAPTATVTLPPPAPSTITITPPAPSTVPDYNPGGTSDQRQNFHNQLRRTNNAVENRAPNYAMVIANSVCFSKHDYLAQNGAFTNADYNDVIQYILDHNPSVTRTDADQIATAAFATLCWPNTA